MMVNPWHPMNDPVDLKHMGKMLEELGELVAASARALIQGIDECEPTTGKCNRDWVSEEMADVLANIALVESRFSLHISETRMSRKKFDLMTWHRLA